VAVAFRIDAARGNCEMGASCYFDEKLCCLTKEMGAVAIANCSYSKVAVRLVGLAKSVWMTFSVGAD
jgi:hypothetical protein